MIIFTHWNHTIVTLKQQLANNIPDDDDDDDKDDVAIKPSFNYRVEEVREPNYHTMVHNIDDLLNLIDKRSCV